MDAIGENWGLDLSRTRAVGEVKSGYSYFEDGDVAFAKVTPCFENGKGALMQGLAQGAGFGTTELTVLRPNQDVCASFLGYVVKSEPFRAVAIASMTGAGGLKRVSDDAVRDFKTYWPELAEQERIANFLDDKTERIDALIAEKEVLVEALKAYAYSFASKAMTSGLDPKAQLKRTSSPEVGSIPSHWKLERLKFLGAVRSGVAKGKELKGADTVTLPYLGVANVQDGYLDLDDVQDIEIAKADATRYLLQLGDVLMNEGGDNDKLGRGAVWQGQVTPCIHQNHVFAVRLTDPTLSQWVARFTSTDAARAYFFLRSKQSTNLASINQTNVRELPVPMPPVEERKAVLAEVIRATGNAEDLISHTKAHIARLREYRSSLISAAVTGQIDVGAYEMTA
jgi:type I restriction enzyme S subunit